MHFYIMPGKFLSIITSPSPLSWYLNGKQVIFVEDFFKHKEPDMVCLGLNTQNQGIITAEFEDYWNFKVLIMAPKLVKIGHKKYNCWLHTSYYIAYLRSAGMS